MDLASKLKSLDGTTLVIVLLIFIIVAMLYLNYRKINEFNASNCSCTVSENLEVVSNQTKPDIAPVVASTENNHEIKNKFVMYYANWCGWSQELLKEWTNKFIGDLNGDESLRNKVKLETVDCDKNEALCSKEQIEGFPTLKLHKENGEIVQYNESDRKSSDMINFLKKNL